MRPLHVIGFILTLALITPAPTRADGFYEAYQYWFKERHAVSPDLPAFKNPMFNGDFMGIPNRRTRAIQLYPDGPIDPKGNRDYGQCTLIVNELDRVVFKCLYNEEWETHHYLNISDPYMHRWKNDTNCYIVEQTCYDDSCEPNQTIFYRPAEKEGCGPAAPRDEWLKSTKGDGDTFHGDLYGSDFKRDRQLRQKLGIPFEPCRHEECKID